MEPNWRARQWRTGRLASTADTSRPCSKELDRQAGLPTTPDSAPDDRQRTDPDHLRTEYHDRPAGQRRSELIEVGGQQSSLLVYRQPEQLAYEDDRGSDTPAARDERPEVGVRGDDHRLVLVRVLENSLINGAAAKRVPNMFCCVLLTGRYWHSRGERFSSTRNLTPTGASPGGTRSRRVRRSTQALAGCHRPRGTGTHR